MATLSEIIRDGVSKCVTCTEIDKNNYCPLIGDIVDWFILNDKTPLKCPKRRKDYENRK